jgi:ribosomal protein S18 acetylase RimI-like enzyme
MTTEVRIRSPKADELDSVRAVVQTVVDEVYGGLWATSPLTIDEEDWSCALVAIEDMRIVGVVLTHDEWISDLWVLRESRRRGLGQELLAKGESEVCERGFRTLRLRVVKSNSAAVNFYLRNGWQVKREFRHEKLPVTMIEMTKTLGSS